MVNILKWGLLCSPFFHFLFINKPLRTSQALLSIAFELLVFLFFFIKLDIKRRPDFKGFVLFFGWILYQSCWFIFRGVLYKDGINIILFPLLHFIPIGLFYIVAALSVKEKYEEIFAFIPWTVSIIALVCIFEKFGFKIFKTNQSWISGILLNPTDNLAYLTACIPLLFFSKRYYLPLILILGALAAIPSSSAILAAIVVLSLIFIRNKQWYFLGFLFSGIIFCLIFFHSREYFADYGKFEVWRIVWESWQKKWLCGYGLDIFSQMGIKIGAVRWIFIHNLILWLLHSLGLVGFILFVNFIYPIISNRKLFYPLMSLISVFIMSLLSVPMRVYPIVLITVINLALLTREVKNGSEIFVSG